MVRTITLATFFFCILFLGGMFFAHFAHAANPVVGSQSASTVPNLGQGGKGGLVPCDGPPLTGSTTPPAGYVACDYNAFVTLIQNVITWVIGTLGTVAAIFFAYAGFLYLTAFGDTNKVNKAHTIFKTVIWGIVIVLVAWLVVQGLIKFLVDPSKITNPLG